MPIGNQALCRHLPTSTSARACVKVIGILLIVLKEPIRRVYSKQRTMAGFVRTPADRKEQRPGNSNHARLWYIGRHDRSTRGRTWGQRQYCQNSFSDQPNRRQLVNLWDGPWTFEIPRSAVAKVEAPCRSCNVRTEKSTHQLHNSFCCFCAPQCGKLTLGKLGCSLIGFFVVGRSTEPPMAVKLRGISEPAVAKTSWVP